MATTTWLDPGVVEEDRLASLDLEDLELVLDMVALLVEGLGEVEALEEVETLEEEILEAEETMEEMLEV